MGVEYSYFATVPRGLADLLAEELTAIGATETVPRAAGVQFQGSLASGYRACLWSRVASRVLLQLSEFEADSADELYRQARQRRLGGAHRPGGHARLRVHRQPPGASRTHISARCASRMRSAIGCARTPARVRTCGCRGRRCGCIAHARGTHVTLALDLAGEGLHRRGYRTEAGEAPLRENLAAGVLLRARWDEAAARGAEFLDPMCGSGTLVIEAAMIAAQRAPGLGATTSAFWAGGSTTASCGRGCASRRVSWRRPRSPASSAAATWTSEHWPWRRPMRRVPGWRRWCAGSIGRSPRRGRWARAAAWSAPTRPTASGWAMRPRHVRRTRRWVGYCASTSRAGTLRS